MSATNSKTLHLPDDFMNQYRKCMQKFSLDRFAKTKLPSWLETHANGPAERIRQLERVAEQLDAVARLGVFQQASVDKAKLVFAEKPNVPQKTAIREN
jgi:predicted Zn-dependent protease